MEEKHSDDIDPQGQDAYTKKGMNDSIWRDLHGIPNIIRYILDYTGNGGVALRYDELLSLEKDRNYESNKGKENKEGEGIQLQDILQDRLNALDNTSWCNTI